MYTVYFWLHKKDTCYNGQKSILYAKCKQATEGMANWDQNQTARTELTLMFFSNNRFQSVLIICYYSYTVHVINGLPISRMLIFFVQCNQSLVTGQFPTGQIPTGQIPTGQFPTGQFPTPFSPHCRFPTDLIPHNFPTLVKNSQQIPNW